ncbi:MAG TPA: tetratricopeptide repeat protein [Candidatus Acidoferrales bacterium]|nr:tetratricopeptide repeat protein [Candidatus Acidoferrales bacterium]
MKPSTPRCPAHAVRRTIAGWAAFFLFFCFSTNLKAGEPSSADPAAAGAPLEQARLHKESGDRFAAEDDFQRAADEYTKALDLRREAFSSSERIRMAVILSWADRLARSRDELGAILAAEPENTEARVHLARVLSWHGELSAAILEADRVLEKAPDNRDALLVKADALHWQGKTDRAIPIYRTLAEKYDDFDARVGLANAYLAIGDRVAAEENRRLLKPPATPQQRRRLAKLVEDLDATGRPQVDLRYSYYNDSDGNLLNRYGVRASFWVGNFDLGVSFRHTQAWGNHCVLGAVPIECRVGGQTGTRRRIRDARAEELLFRLYTRATESVGLGAGLGWSQVADASASTFPTGHLKADAKILNGTVGLGVSREVLSDTAELIRNRIRTTIGGFYLSQSLTDRLSFWGGYNYKSFSDDNRAHDAQTELKYFLFLNPRIALGHRFRFLDFARQSRSGFFDPDDYVSNRAFLSFYLERQRFYVYIDGFAGQQRFERNGVRSRDFVKGGSASIGVRPVPRLTLEFSVEGGDFAAASASGFSYLLLGPRILYRF